MGKTLDFVQAQQEEMLKKAQALATSYADSNVIRFMRTIEAALEMDGDTYTWNRAHAMDEFKRILATSYALGYIDRKENQELKTLHV